MINYMLNKYFYNFCLFRNEFIRDKLEKIVSHQDDNGLDNIDKNLLNITYITAEERYILFYY